MQAFDDMYYFERAAEVVVKTRSMNLPVKYIPEETCRKFKACQDAGAEVTLAILLYSISDCSR